MILERYLKDYYNGLLTNRDIADREGIKEHSVARILRADGYKTYQDVLNDLGFENKKLKSLLIQKYNSLKGRCLGFGSSDKYNHYKGKSYPGILEWTRFCNLSKSKLISMWEVYMSSGKNLKYAISVDRVNNDGDYSIDNIQFITNGFNSWKSTLNPISVLHEGELLYFMSCEEASRHFDIRPQAIGECLNLKKYCSKEYAVSRSNVDVALTSNGCKTLEEHYTKYIKNGRMIITK